MAVILSKLLARFGLSVPNANAHSQARQAHFSEAEKLILERRWIALLRS